MGCLPGAKKQVISVENLSISKIKHTENTEASKTMKTINLKEVSNNAFQTLRKGGTMYMTDQGNHMKIQTYNYIQCKTTPIEDDYTILSKIGSGAYGQVYKVKQKRTDMIRAMKVINKYQCKKFFDSDHAVFEGDYLKTLDHPNIIKMYDSYSTEESYYIILEFINGGELYDTIITFKHFTEKVASKLMYQLLSAIAYLHNMNFVHRDIKPENILVEASEIIEFLENKQSLKNTNKTVIEKETNNNEILVSSVLNSNLFSSNSLVNTLKGENISILMKNSQLDFNIILIDFGACTYLEHGKLLSMKFGTPYYMAPEVLKQKYDFKCDVWSCGIIMHTLLIGHPPFLGANNKEILKKVELGKISYEGEKWNKISQEAKTLLKQLLEYDPLKRISAQQALSNKWITSWQNSSSSEFETVVLSDILNNIKNFRAIEKFQQAAIAYIVHYTNSSSQNHQLRRIFKSFDKNGDGILTYKEFKEGYKRVFGNEFTTEEELSLIVSKMDQNNDNKIEYEEFLRISLNQQKVVSEENLKIAFENFDSDKNGSLSRDEIKHILKDADEKYIDELFMLIDLDKNGTISFDEFKRMMEILIRKNSSLII